MNPPPSAASPSSSARPTPSGGLKFTATPRPSTSPSSRARRQLQLEADVDDLDVERRHRHAEGDRGEEGRSSLAPGEPQVQRVDRDGAERLLDRHHHVEPRGAAQRDAVARRPAQVRVGVGAHRDWEQALDEAVALGRVDRDGDPAAVGGGQRAGRDGDVGLRARR